MHLVPAAVACLAQFSVIARLLLPFSPHRPVTVNFDCGTASLSGSWGQRFAMFERLSLRSTGLTAREGDAAGDRSVAQ